MKSHVVIDFVTLALYERLGTRVNSHEEIVKYDRFPARSNAGSIETCVCAAVTPRSAATTAAAGCWLVSAARAFAFASFLQRDSDNQQRSAAAPFYSTSPLLLLRMLRRQKTEDFVLSIKYLPLIRHISGHGAHSRSVHCRGSHGAEQGIRAATSNIHKCYVVSCALLCWLAAGCC